MGDIYTSDVHCKLLDGDTCRCTDYPNRHERVPDCIGADAGQCDDHRLDPQDLRHRRVAEGKGLAWWHPLVSGDPQTVIDAGVSIRGRTGRRRVR